MSKARLIADRHPQRTRGEPQVLCGAVADRLVQKAIGGNARSGQGVEVVNRPNRAVVLIINKRVPGPQELMSLHDDLIVRKERSQRACLAERHRELVRDEDAPVDEELVVLEVRGEGDRLGPVRPGEAGLADESAAPAAASLLSDPLAAEGE